VATHAVHDVTLAPTAGYRAPRTAARHAPATSEDSRLDGDHRGAAVDVASPRLRMR
jgi:hypothetical protein